MPDASEENAGVDPQHAASPDQELTAQVCDGGLLARLTVPPRFDTDLLTPDLCQVTLMGVDVVVNKQAQECICAGIEAYDPKADKPHIIEIPAQRPVHGEDGRFVWEPEFDPDQDDPAQEDAAITADASKDDGQAAVDYYNLSCYITVNTGDVLGQLIAPTHGEDGVDVRGKMLPAKPGREFKHNLDESILIDGKGQYIAQINGVLQRDGDKLWISPELQVPQDVDFGTGNIRFDGDVEILRGVKDCFKVECTGDLITRGLVEAATIIVGGDYEAAGGMASKEKGRLEVGGNMTARYLDNVEGKIKRDLQVQREMINCQLSIGGSLEIPTSALIGGTNRVLGRVHVATLGSASGMGRTELHLGSEPKFEDLLDAVAQALGKKTAERDEVQCKLDALNNAKAGSTNTQREELTVLMCEVSALNDQVRALQERRDKVRSYFELMRKVNLQVEKAIHPKTCLVIGKQVVNFKETVKGPLTICHKRDGQLVWQRANSQQQQPLSAIAEVTVRETGKSAA